VSVLVEAAQQADAQTAARCLELALGGAADDAERSRIVTMLARAEWEADPATAGRHVPGLIRALAAGHLRGGAAVFAVRHLLWYGHVDEADAALAALGAAADGALTLHAIGPWLWFGRPKLLTEAAPPPPAGPDRLSAAGTPTQAATALADAMRRPATDGTIALAEQMLQRARLDDSLIGALLAAQVALIYLDRPDRASTWSEVLNNRSSVTQSPPRRALVAAIQAEAALRQGDLPGAYDLARTALDLMTPAGWGLMVGLPLSTVIAAATQMGRHDEAAELLGHPLPERMSDTIPGLHHLHARGRHALATGRPEAALHDFEACGEALAGWGIDPPAVVPWRIDAAWALIRLGEEHQARRLAERQLTAIRSGYARTRGAALRVLAATHPPRRRRQLLREAVEILQASGDRLELANALADLSETYYALGESNGARLTVRRAHHLARACQAETPYQILLPRLADAGLTATDPAPPGEVPHAASPGDGLTSLSEAEQRVAVLAAYGHSNREIARELYITSSTVEQHLTRIYRKLKVHRRSDLPVRLRL
jgi:DNA-binding NarL/FixJ family response regulator